MNMPDWLGPLILYGVIWVVLCTVWRVHAAISDIAAIRRLLEAHKQQQDGGKA